ncbi:MAG: protein kinase, partial [Ignavibacteria bacterium]|nr:protein kinase [Ignavibacteria bacterium]
EQQAWREICAYAALTTHENLIRYYSSWIENDGRFFIQLEHCNGGSLEDLIEKNRKDNKFLNEDVLKTILHQMSNVLSFMHRNDLAHIDIKPSNIMLCYYTDNDVIYKLTDLGHISQISSCTVDNDGDCRYLALEIIQKSNSTSLHLDKCDIYSLGLTLYACATNYIMPKEGNEWQQLRLNITQFLHRISQCSKQFNELLLERMCNIDPTRRPSAYEVCIYSIKKKIFSNIFILVITRSTCSTSNTNKC